MQDRSSSPSMGNIMAFVAVVLIALVFPAVWHHFNPAPPQVANAPAAGDEKKAEADKNVAQKPAADKDNKKPDQKNTAVASQPKPSDDPVDQTAKNEKPDKSRPEAAVKPAAPPDNDDRRWITIGSVDPDGKDNPYRMLITLDRLGGSLARLELSSEHYRDLDDRSGYLGHLVMDENDKGPGCLVQVVGAGTPAAKAGVKAGDRITKAAYRGSNAEIAAPGDEEKSDGTRLHLETVLRHTEPGAAIELTIRSGNAEVKKTVQLIRRPLEVIRPERIAPEMKWMKNGPLDATNLDENCPQSFLTTLQQVDNDKLRMDEDPNGKFEEEIARELPGIRLRDAMWKIESPKKGQEPSPVTKVVFSCDVPEQHLTITKTYELEKVEGDATARAYHLVLSVSIANNDTKKHDVAFRQDGANGLPAEGSWYASTKVSRTWSTEGLRDVIFQLADSDVGVVTCSQLSEKGDKGDKFRRDIGESSEFEAHRPLFFGVDAQYFSVIMMPDADSTAGNIERAVALRVGKVEELRRTLTNTSLRIISKPFSIEPGKTSETQRYEVFAGPKSPDLLKNYTLPWRAGGAGESKADLSGLITYGWFRMVGAPMTRVLEFFYSLVHNYGLAVIMLTIVVRLLMFPVSRKQALNAQMMQKLQPEMKAIQAKFKKDPEAARKAQQELFAKHNYNPLGGCLLLFIQMPIFLGLYRALQVDVELRGAPLISEAVRWCSNLAAPDMLFDWHSFMPDTVNSGVGYPGFPLIGSALGLGPYLNIIPLITIALYLVQQKVMMPPAVDEQAQTQQNMMKYMMIFFGLMFYKIASGLCIYFIASTIWGLAERRFLPKTSPASGNDNGDEDMAVLEKPRLPSKPRLTDAEREAIRRQKKRK